MITSPYAGLGPESWRTRTKELIEAHPLKPAEIVQSALQSWDLIFSPSTTVGGLRIGIDVFPGQQVIGGLLHELIAHHLASRYPGAWRREHDASEKDVVYVPDPLYSIEIKTSSSSGRIFGNRSVSQPSKKRKKEKSGYYLAINCQSFTQGFQHPQVRRIRFGWLDHADWTGQDAPSGQQASLGTWVLANKLLDLYTLKEGNLR